MSRKNKISKPAFHIGAFLALGKDEPFNDQGI